MPNLGALPQHRVNHGSSSLFAEAYYGVSVPLQDTSLFSVCGFLSVKFGPIHVILQPWQVKHHPLKLGYFLNDSFTWSCWHSGHCLWVMK